MGDAHALPSLPGAGNGDIWVLVALRRELCAIDQVRLALQTYLSWIPSKSSEVICWVNEPQRKSPSEFHCDPCPLLSYPFSA